METTTHADVPNGRCTTCPVCGHECEHEESLQQHIMVGHRKSTVTDELLSTVRDPSQ
jgi:hypothetical protein